MTSPTSGLLDGRRILVVEDDYLIAQELCDVLRDCGAEVVGPVSRLEMGLELARETEGLDCAILDLNLNGKPATEIARALKSRSISLIL